MFERFTEQARKVVVLAQGEAERLRHDYVGTEHLLLGMLREEEGVAAQALRACSVTLAGVREQVEGIVGFGEEHSGQAPFTPRAKRVLELSLREAQGMGHNYIGTGYLLLGLLSEGGGVAARVFADLGIAPDRVREEIVSRLETGTRPRPQREPGPMDWTRKVLRRSFGRRQREDRPVFDKFTAPGRKVAVLAQDEARYFNHNYIGTEHLLLGLLREEDGLAARVLAQLGVGLNEAREQVESIVGYGEEPMGAQLPLTPRTKKVLQMASMEAMQLDHDYVSAEHVMLGLAREGEGVAARILVNLGVDPDEVHREVVRGLQDAGPESDPFGEIEEEMEREEEDRLLFRGRVDGIGAELALPRPLAVTVDADYAYRASTEAEGGSATVEPGDVADLMLAGLRETEARSLEAVIAMLGGRLLDAFAAMLEVTVTISGAPEPADPPAPTFSVSATFRR